MSLVRLFFVTVLAGITIASAASSRPNIILIMADDQGYGVLGINGNPVLETPHMHALARDRGFASFFGFSASTDIPPCFFIRGDRAVVPPTETIAESKFYPGQGWSPM